MKSIFLTLAMIAVVVHADDWPQWRGPNRTGISTEKGWQTQWPKEGPKQIWQAKVGVGYSSMSVAKGHLYTMGNVNEQDIVFGLDANSGKEIWRHTYPCSSKDPNGYPGTRCTPTVEGNSVYTLSRQGHLHCYDATTGKVIWSKDYIKDFGATEPTWGFAGSPLVHGKHLIIEPGGSGTAVVALNMETGEVVWKSGDEPAGYSSPIAFGFKGSPALAVFGAKSLTAYAAADGKPLWSYPWQTSYDVNAATPIIEGNRAFVSSGYNAGCALIDFSSGAPREIWRNKNMRNHVNSCVLFKNRIYGFDENTLKCLDFDSGNVLWSEKKYGKGSLMVANEKLILFSESGLLGVAETSADKYQEIASAQVVGGKSTWAAPVLANGKIYVRSLENLVAFDVSGTAAGAAASAESGSNSSKILE